MRSNENKFFTVESYNHKCFVEQGKPFYTMIWGPFPIEMYDKEIITSNIRKFDKDAVILKYRHSDRETEVA